MIWSNAVIEYEGTYTQQLPFLNEMLSISQKVFFATPNKYFPVEAHTNMLLLHYCDGLFYFYLRKHTTCTRETLNLLSYCNLVLLMKNSNASMFRIIKNRFVEFTMIISVIA